MKEQVLETLKKEYDAKTLLQINDLMGFETSEELKDLQDVLEELFEEKYESKDENFAKLINTYTGYRDDTPLKELILTIYKYIQSNPYPEKWLDEKIEMFNLSEKLEEDFSKTIWGELLLKQVREIVEDSELKLEAERQNLVKYPELQKYFLIINDDIEQLQMLKINLDSWNKAYEIASNIKFKTWATDKKITFEAKDDAKATRDMVKANLKKVTEKILIFNSKEANEDINDMYEVLKKLGNIIIEFGKMFEKRKKDKNIVDFSDVEHFALQILLKEDGTPSEIAKKYQQKYEEIAIDEYQDSNLVQEYILNSISRENNIFMVGDVKQSIYKFRQARPDLFLEKYKTYQTKNNQKDGDNLKIQLFKNFRSRKEVLDFSNKIFTSIMSEELGELNYTEEEYLNLGANYEDTNQDLKAEIDILLADDIETEQKASTTTTSNWKETNEDENDSEEEIERVENIELEDGRAIVDIIRKNENQKCSIDRQDMTELLQANGEIGFYMLIIKEALTGAVTFSDNENIIVKKLKNISDNLLIDEKYKEKREKINQILRNIFNYQDNKEMRTKYEKQLDREYDNLNNYISFNVMCEFEDEYRQKDIENEEENILQ